MTPYQRAIPPKHAAVMDAVKDFQSRAAKQVKKRDREIKQGKETNTFASSLQKRRR